MEDFWFKTNRLLLQTIYQENFGKNVLDFDNERSKIFEKKYDEIDFLVLNDYITIEEGNKRTEVIKKEYSGFYHFKWSLFRTLIIMSINRGVFSF